MSEILKVPAKAGAQWLWAGFALLWRAPLRLGAWPVVGHVFLIADAGGLQVAKRAVLRAVSDVSSHPTTDGGVLWALREVDQGRTARPGDLLQGLYDGRVPQLLMALLPQLLALVVTFLVIHYSSLQGFSKFLGDLMTMHQPGAQINPEAIYQSYVDLPMPLIRLWLLFLCVIFVVVAMTLFVMPPQVMFQRDNGLHALKLSLYACLRNLPALLVFALLACIVTIVVFVIVSFIAIVPAAFIAAVLGRGDEVFLLILFIK